MEKSSIFKMDLFKRSPKQENKPIEKPKEAAKPADIISEISVPPDNIDEPVKVDIPEAIDMPFIRVPQKRMLWGQEFDIVESGFKEEQIIKFVNSLIRKYKQLANNQIQPVSSDTISDRMAKEIKSMAKKQADAEAAHIIAQANHKAREIVGQARNHAQEATSKEVEEILDSARQKSKIIEAEARQRAHLYLINSRNTIKEQLGDEIKHVYSQLFTSLQDLLGKGHDVESEWKSRTANSWRSGVSDIDLPSSMHAALVEEGESTPLSDDLNYMQHEDIDLPSSMHAALVEEGENTPLPDDMNHVQHEEKDLATSLEVLKEELTTDKEDLEEMLTSLLSAEKMEEEPGVLPKVETTVPAETMTEKKPEIINHSEAIPQSEKQRETPTMGKTEKQKHEQHKREEHKPIIPTYKESKVIYEGEVDLVLVPPVDLPLLTEIHKKIESMPEAKIIQTVGSWDKSTTIKLSIDKPIPLANVLANITGVELVAEYNPNSPEIKNAKDKSGAKNKIKLKTGS